MAMKRESDWIERCSVVQILLATRRGAAGTDVDLARRHQQPSDEIEEIPSMSKTDDRAKSRKTGHDY
jgi:hypothetical protein